ncbi:MAG: hypothetical protein II077_01155 [Treponema sp.]|nr:hypothetical protein [Treponema sp.]
MIRKISIRAFLLLAMLFFFDNSLKCQAARKEGFEPFLNLGFFAMSVNGEQLAQNSDYDRYSSNQVLRQIPLFIVPVPFLTGGCKHTLSKGIVSFRNSADMSLSFAGIGASYTSSVSITPLFSVFAKASIGTAWNYGNWVDLIGIYNPAESEYDPLTSFSEFFYGMAFGARAMAPLPKHNIIQLSFNTDYVAFSGADDGEPWVCGTERDCVNGWRYEASAMLAHTFDGPKLKMVGLSSSISGRYSADDFDKVYQPYNPAFKTYSIGAMSQFTLTEKQSLLLMLNVSRKRKFERDTDEYEAEETLMQKYVGAKWGFDGIMIMWNINLL